MALSNYGACAFGARLRLRLRLTEKDRIWIVALSSAGLNRNRGSLLLLMICGCFLAGILFVGRGLFIYSSFVREVLPQLLVRT